ncbi:ABC1 family protein MCP2 [Neolecta irregularis DAH-3]|uniref:ABC1 family protein MCP2 n=1 Tax=Neolecta irregularis (strain DAH-3) TaxID=1198029 RepID=A0A1U7LPU8_NEOID|nr:ABC1 family protein MCP2 [Neolecta irregularis DAH-3]|eukprot:OLL24700.1 ABC1 family protein MCP2 [Neolecta irregularis DAH-3]
MPPRFLFRPARSHPPQLTSRTSRKSSGVRRHRTILYTTLGLSALGITTYSADSTKHSIIAVTRCARVASAVGLVFQDYYKTINATYITAKERLEAISECHYRCAKKALSVFERNGGIYIKLGQHLSSMGYLIPLEWTTTMTALQDQCPASSLDSIHEMFLTDLSMSLDDLFSSFDPIPIGVASLAQVHKATLRSTGQIVAVKLQHPSLQEFVPIDLATTRWVFGAIKTVFPDFKLTWLSDEMGISLPQELDFRLEAQNARRTAKHFEKVSGSALKIPDMIWAEKRILIMEFIQGSRIDDLEFFKREKISRSSVSAELARIFNEMIFGDTGLHCDPHQGNLLIRPRPCHSRSKYNFEVVLLDHGLYRDIYKPLRCSYAHLWLSIINSDLDGMRKYSKEVAGISDSRWPLFASAITGRDFSVLMHGISTPRNEEEYKRINTAVGQGLVLQLIDLLSQIPPILLLLLKTNDLTRALDESLKLPPSERPFVILARYCAKVVYQEECESSSFLKRIRLLGQYSFLQFKLSIYEKALGLWLWYLIRIKGY